MVASYIGDIFMSRKERLKENVKEVEDVQLHDEQDETSGTGGNESEDKNGLLGADDEPAGQDNSLSSEDNEPEHTEDEDPHNTDGD